MVAQRLILFQLLRNLFFQVPKRVSSEDSKSEDPLSKFQRVYPLSESIILVFIHISKYEQIFQA